MKYSLLIACLTHCALPVLAQTDHYFTESEVVVDASEYGNIRPHVVSFHQGVGVIWSKPNGNLYFSQKDGDSAFGQPFKLNQSIGSVFAASYGGADIAGEGDRLFVTFMTTPYLQAKVYWTLSDDRGTSWTTPQQLALPDSIIPFLPTVALDEQGNPAIMLMAYDSNYADPQYVVARSTDGGSSFSELVSFSEDAPHEVCDCCPAHLLAGQDATMAFFRNNDANIRDIWYAHIKDEDNYADTVFDIDPSDWYIAGCPSTGPDAAFTSKGVHSVWSSSGFGHPQVLMSVLDPTTNEVATDFLSSSDLSQFTPRIAASGDTIAIVYEQIESPITTSVIMWSLDGGDSFTVPIDFVKDSSGIYNAPDIAYSNQGFDLVYRDIFDASIRYKRLEFGLPASVGSAAEELGMRVFPNPSNGIVRVEGLLGPTAFTLLDVMGRKFLEGELDANTPILDISALPSGVYILTVQIAGESSTRLIRH